MKLFGKLNFKKLGKKDNVFVLTMGIVLVNLMYQTANLLNGTYNYLRAEVEHSALPYLLLLILANAFAIFGVLWLVRSYRRTNSMFRACVRNTKEIEEQLNLAIEDVAREGNSQRIAGYIDALKWVLGQK